MDMKLNKYIYEKITNMFDPETMSDYFSEKDIERWIFLWYEEVYDRAPPMWLAGNRWYDRRAKKIKEAEEKEKENEV